MTTATRRGLTLATSLLVCCVLDSGIAVAGTVTFSDTFSPPSSLWSNSSGSWTASGGDYFATVPNNSPAALTVLPFGFTNTSVQVTVTVNNLGDGGIVFQAGTTNSVVFVDGGEGYGQGARGGSAGTSAYWGTATNPTTNLVSGVFTPGNTYTLTVTDVGGTLKAYNDVDGKFDSTSILLTSLVDPALTGFKIGLYDDQPNTTAGGFGPAQSFSNFSVVGSTAATGVPEPASWLLMLGGLVGVMRRRSKLRIA